MSTAKWFDLKVNYITSVQQALLLPQKPDEPPSSLPDEVAKKLLSQLESVLRETGPKYNVQKLNPSNPVFSSYIDKAPNNGSLLSLEQVEQVNRAVTNELKDHFKVVVNKEYGGIVLRVYLI